MNGEGGVGDRMGLGSGGGLGERGQEDMGGVRREMSGGKELGNESRG